MNELWPEGMEVGEASSAPHPGYVKVNVYPKGCAAGTVAVASAIAETPEQAKARAEAIAAIPEAVAALSRAAGVIAKHEHVIPDKHLPVLRDLASALARLSGNGGGR